MANKEETKNLMLENSNDLESEINSIEERIAKIEPFLEEIYTQYLLTNPTNDYLINADAQEEYHISKFPKFISTIFEDIAKLKEKKEYKQFNEKYKKEYKSDFRGDLFDKLYNKLDKNLKIVGSLHPKSEFSLENKLSQVENKLSQVETGKKLKKIDEDRVIQVSQDLNKQKFTETKHHDNIHWLKVYYADMFFEKFYTDIEESMSRKKHGDKKNSTKDNAHKKLSSLLSSRLNNDMEKPSKRRENLSDLANIITQDKKYTDLQTKFKQIFESYSAKSYEDLKIDIQKTFYTIMYLENTLIKNPKCNREILFNKLLNTITSCFEEYFKSEKKNVESPDLYNMLTKISDDIFPNDIPAKYSPSYYKENHQKVFENFKVKLDDLIKKYQTQDLSANVPQPPAKIQSDIITTTIYQQQQKQQQQQKLKA